MAQSVYDYQVTTNTGQQESLSKYKGKISLIVNTASRCGFTPQYADLEQIYKKYKDAGFQVLAFPTNDFGWQEPGSNEEIAEFCSNNFNISFPLFAKIKVRGSKAEPLFKYLTAKETTSFPGMIKWNFEKFLIDPNGQVLARYSSRIKPTSEQIMTDIEKALDEMKSPSG